MTLSGLHIVIGADGVDGTLPVYTNIRFESKLGPKLLTAFTLKLYFVSTVKLYKIVFVKATLVYIIVKLDPYLDMLIV